MKLTLILKTVCAATAIGCVLAAVSLNLAVGWDAPRAGRVPQFLIDALIARDPRVEIARYLKLAAATLFVAAFWRAIWLYCCVIAEAMKMLLRSRA